MGTLGAEELLGDFDPEHDLGTALIRVAGWQELPGADPQVAHLDQLLSRTDDRHRSRLAAVSQGLLSSRQGRRTLDERRSQAVSHSARTASAREGVIQ